MWKQSKTKENQLTTRPCGYHVKYDDKNKCFSKIWTSHELVLLTPSSFNEITNWGCYMSHIKTNKWSSKLTSLIAYTTSEVSKFVCSTRRHRHRLTKFLYHIGNIIPDFVFFSLATSNHSYFRSYSCICIFCQLLQLPQQGRILSRSKLWHSHWLWWSPSVKA